MCPDLTIKKTIVGFFRDTIQARFFNLCIVITLLGVYQIHTWFDDLNLVSRLQVCQNHKCFFLFLILVHRSVNVVWFLRTLKGSCTLSFV